MAIKISSGHLAEIRKHGEETYPYECCGLLLGKEQAGVKVLQAVRRVENSREDSRHNRYLIPPQEIVRGERYARENGMDVIGFYHSHPDHPARPSGYDLDHAWPWYSYIIVSIEQGKAADLNSWLMQEDRTGFDQEEIIKEG